jgi:hypothetical protein
MGGCATNAALRDYRATRGVLHQSNLWFSPTLTTLIRSVAVACIGRTKLAGTLVGQAQVRRQLVLVGEHFVVLRHRGDLALRHQMHHLVGWTALTSRARAKSRLSGGRSKLVAAAVVEFIDRLHQADVAFLDEIEELQAAVGVFLRDRDDEA